jgi:hypothetical protein
MTLRKTALRLKSIDTKTFWEMTRLITGLLKNLHHLTSGLQYQLQRKEKQRKGAY